MDKEYVSRAANKLESVTRRLNIDFKDKVVLDVGSSTGGFTEYALKSGAKKVIAVDKGTNQMDKLLRLDQRIELHEKTDIIDFNLNTIPDLVLIDVSFVSIRVVLSALLKIIDKNTVVIAMVKPQFEVNDEYKNRGIIKNEKIRRNILSDFENWAKRKYIVINKADSLVSGTKGNVERFYLLKLI
jgi:23S rRNA (cytidine1920-2'-O)/16S rRNA (cytidine1409-2'-O)-methyltransferase